MIGRNEFYPIFTAGINSKEKMVQLIKGKDKKFLFIILKSIRYLLCNNRILQREK